MTQSIVGTKNDEHYKSAVYLTKSLGFISASAMQQTFKIGYNRSLGIFDAMHEAGVVEKFDKKRKGCFVVNSKTKLCKWTLFKGIAGMALGFALLIYIELKVMQ